VLVSLPVALAAEKPCAPNRTTGFDVTTEARALALDAADPLARYRD